MRGKEYLEIEKPSFKYYDLVKKAIYDLYPLRTDKLNTFKYFNRYLYADARYHIEKETFKLRDGEVDHDIAYLVRIEILNAIMYDDSLIYAYNIIVLGENSYTNYPKLKGYRPKGVDENTLSNINKLIRCYKEDYPKNKLCMFLTDIVNKNYYDKSNYKLSKDYNWWLKAFNMAYEIFDKIRVNSRFATEAFKTVEDINTGDDALDLTIKEIICYLSDKYNFDITEEQQVMLSLLSDYIKNKYIEKEVDMPSDGDGPIELNSKVEKSKESSKITLTCSQQTKVLMYVFNELGLDLDNTKKIKIAEFIGQITGKNVRNILDRMKIDFDKKSDIRDLKLIVELIRPILPEIAIKIENDLKPYL